MLSNREKYRQFCETEEMLPIFMKDWWLDMVCGEDSWDTAIVEHDGDIVGVLPYYCTKKIIFKLMVPPHLTRWFGPWIKYPDGLKGRKKISFEHHIYEDLIVQLPKVDWGQIGCAPTTTNVKAFFWKGFVQSVKYIGIVERHRDVNDFFDRLDKETRKRIQKAAISYKIVKDLDFDRSLNLFKKPYERQNIKFRTPDSLIRNVLEKSKKYGRAIILGAENQLTQKIDSAIFCVWDKTYFYLLMSGGNLESRKKYAKYLLTFEAIKTAWSKNLIFNFDGSMKHSIDSFNRKFLTKEITYFTLEKINSKILKCYFALK